MSRIKYFIYIYLFCFRLIYICLNRLLATPRSDHLQCYETIEEPIDYDDRTFKFGDEYGLNTI